MHGERRMKFVIFNQNRPGVVVGEEVFEIGSLIKWNAKNMHPSLLHFIENYDEYKGIIEASLPKLPSYELSAVKLEAPVPNPSKIIAAPVNYFSHQDEMNEMFNNAPHTVEILKLFLKAPSSIIGPDDSVRLPYKDRRHDHEAELAFVVGKQAKDVKYEDAKDYIFGYFCLLDMTLRGDEERTFRKSFDTFTPIGPWIITADELGDPHVLDMKLWVNDELRQSTNTQKLILDCYKCFEIASHNMTLYPGDIITTGTPDGVGQVVAGDKIKMTIENVGSLSVTVENKYK